MKIECPKCGSTDNESADGYGYTYLICQSCGHDFVDEGAE